MSEGWIELFRTAIAAEAPRAAVLALATVNHQGHPQVRSIICRRLDENGAVWMTCDARSEKVTELSAHSHAAVSCWLPETRQQFRLNGQAEMGSTEAERQNLWTDLRLETRATFFWPTPAAAKTAESVFLPASNKPLPPETFTVLILRPDQVELLELKPHPHRRRRWTLRNSWQSEELNP